MNVTMPEKLKLSEKQIIIYISIIAFCIISIIIAFYVQFYARIDYMELLGIKSNEYQKKTDEETETLKANFNTIFNNSITNVSEQNNDKRKDKEKPIIYTSLEKQENKTNSYDINVHIPYINIDNETIDKYNKEIEETFVNKANSILKTQNKNENYTVDYVANIEYDILSLMIRANLKEGTSAQRIIIQTYNYDLRNNKEISLEEVLKIKNIDINDTQNQIKEEIKNEQKKVDDLKALGYNIYSRDTSSDIYDIKNSKEFYLTNDALYIIYAYGNEKITSEMDMVII